MKRKGLGRKEKKTYQKHRNQCCILSCELGNSSFDKNARHYFFWEEVIGMLLSNRFLNLNFWLWNLRIELMLHCSPTQCNPFPVKPSLQAQENDPWLFVQLAFVSQLCDVVLDAHSSTSDKHQGHHMKISSKTLNKGQKLALILLPWLTCAVFSVACITAVASADKRTVYVFASRTGVAVVFVSDGRTFINI